MKLSMLKNDIHAFNMRMNSLGTFGQPRSFAGGAFIPSAPDWKRSKKKKKSKKSQKAHMTVRIEADLEAANAEADLEAANAEADLEAANAEADLEAANAEADVKKANTKPQKTTEPGAGLRAAAVHRAPASMELREAIVWAEVLGEPVSRKRRRRRVSLQNGNQSNAGRR